MAAYLPFHIPIPSATSQITNNKFETL